VCVDDDRLTASSGEGAGAIKLECKDGRRLDVVDAEWTQPSTESSTRTLLTDVPRTCSGKDEAAAALFKDLCDGLSPTFCLHSLQLVNTITASRPSVLPFFVTVRN